jgi:hypothetical protein
MPTFILTCINPGISFYRYQNDQHQSLYFLFKRYNLCDLNFLAAKGGKRDVCELSHYLKIRASDKREFHYQLLCRPWCT